MTELGRRIAAAQAFGGFRSVPELAKATNRNGLSAQNIRRIMAGTKTPDDWHLEAIAKTTGVPVRFFTDEDPWAQPAEADLPDHIAYIEQCLEDLAERADRNFRLSAMVLENIRGTAEHVGFEAPPIDEETQRFLGAPSPELPSRTPGSTDSLRRSRRRAG